MSGPRTLRRFAGLAAVAAVLALGVACGGGGGDDLAGRLVVAGRAEVGAPGEAVRDVRGTEPVKFGERVNLRDGTGVIRLTGDGDRQVELRTGSYVELGAAADGGDRVVRPVVIDGDLLAITGSSSLPVASGNAVVMVHGTAQIAKGESVTVTAYAGRADVTVSGQTLTVPAFRQVVVPAEGPLPAQPSPAVYDADDSWDERYLGDANGLGIELDARSQGFSAQLRPSEGRTADYYSQLLPPLADQPTFTTDSLGSRPPGETLIGAAIVLEGARGTFEQRWAEVFGFRDQGAPWGLVALDQGVTRVAVIGRVDEAIGRAPSSLGGPGNGGQSAAPARPPGGSNAPATTVPPAGPGPAPASPTTTAPPSSPPLDPKGPLNTGIPLIDDLVNALVETLSGLLRGLGGG